MLLVTMYAFYDRVSANQHSLRNIALVHMVFLECSEGLQADVQAWSNVIQSHGYAVLAEQLGRQISAIAARSAFLYFDLPEPVSVAPRFGILH